MYLPTDMIRSFGVNPEDVHAGRLTPPLRALLAELRALARRHLTIAWAAMRGLEPKLIPAFLPVALVEPRLKLAERKGFDPFRMPAEIAAWRRQWIVWRAARRFRDGSGG
jgi:phytoene synthase